jgi:uncharacterized membrane protein YhhN
VNATRVCVVLAALGLAGQLYARRTGQRRAEGTLKTVTSVLFLAVAGLEAREANGYTLWIGVALTLSVLGDVLMIGKGRKWLAGGLAAFLLAHLAFLVAFVPLVNLAYVNPIGFAVTLASVVLVGTVTTAVVEENLGALRIPSYLYVFVLGSMTVVAVSAWLTEPTRLGHRQIALGALLFLASDVAVALQRFRAATFETRVWGLSSYYMAQVLFALSVGHVTGW